MKILTVFSFPPLSLSLSLSLQNLSPPKGDRVPMQATADCGTVQTSSGPRNVSKGEIHFMSRSDAAPLVRKGLMTQVSMD